CKGKEHAGINPEQDASQHQQIIRNPAGFRSGYPDGKHVISQGGQYDHPQRKGRYHREGFGIGQRAEEFPFAGFHQEDRQETDDGGQHGGGKGARNFRHRLGDQTRQGFSAAFPAPGFLFVHVPDNAFDQHNAYVHHHADGDGDTRQGHDICLHTHLLHDDEACQHADGQNARNEDGCAQIDDQYNDHNDADQNLMRQRTFKRSDGFLNQPRAIVEGNHGDFRDGTVRQGLLRKPRFHFPDRGLDLVDDLHGICSVTGNHHASYRLHAFLIEAAAPGGGANGYKGDVFDLYRDLIAHGNHGILQVLNTLEVAQSAHQVFGLVDFNGFRADIEVAVLDRVHDIHDRYPVVTHGLGIHIDLIFLYKAADGGELG